tara:strand:+ start:4198 stop:4410 length:213 start_codon:yes stop_codon:yes gene_type:complete
MLKFEQRFKQTGGAYSKVETKERPFNNKKKNLSPKSENWRKQYLLMKSERDNLQNENKKLKKKIRKLEKK